MPPVNSEYGSAVIKDSNSFGFTYLALGTKTPILRTPERVDDIVDRISPLLFFSGTRFIVVTRSDLKRELSPSPCCYTLEGFGVEKGVIQWTALFDGNTFYFTCERDHFIEMKRKAFDSLCYDLGSLVSEMRHVDAIYSIN